MMGVLRTTWCFTVSTRVGIQCVRARSKTLCIFNTFVEIWRPGYLWAKAAVITFIIFWVEKSPVVAQWNGQWMCLFLARIVSAHCQNCFFWRLERGSGARKSQIWNCYDDSRSFHTCKAATEPLDPRDVVQVKAWQEHRQFFQQESMQDITLGYIRIYYINYIILYTYNSYIHV